MFRTFGQRVSSKYFISYTFPGERIVRNKSTTTFMLSGTKKTKPFQTTANRHNEQAHSDRPPVAGSCVWLSAGQRDLGVFSGIDRVG